MATYFIFGFVTLKTYLMTCLLKAVSQATITFFQTMVKYLVYFVKSHSVFKLGIYMLGSYYKKMYIRKSILRYLKPEAIKVGNLSNCPELLSAVREKKRQS